MDDHLRQMTPEEQRRYNAKLWWQDNGAIVLVVAGVLLLIGLAVSEVL
jgi:predicted negative regulator of RcsB-dependent stress response